MFYERLKVLCDEVGEKLTTVVVSLGMSPGNIGKWKKGYSPRGDTLLEFAKHFHVTTDYLLGVSDEKNANEKEPAPVLSELEQALIDVFRRVSAARQLEIIHYSMGKLDEEPVKKVGGLSGERLTA